MILAFFSGVGGESSHCFWVPYSRGQGGVTNIQNGGPRRGEFFNEEKAHWFHARGQYLEGKYQGFIDDLRAERQLTLEKDEQLLAAKEKLKKTATRSVKDFQQTDEYNTVLFSWYFKGFELLRRYLVKHPTGVDLQNLDLEVVDQEMATDEAAQSSIPEGDVPADDTDAAGNDAPMGDGAVASPWTFVLMEKKKNLLARHVLGFFFKKKI